MTKHSPARRPVVAIRVLSSNAKAAGDPPSLREDKLVPGDIVEQIQVGSVTLNAPFAGGKTGLQMELRRHYKVGDTHAQVKVRRLNNKHVEMQLSIVPHDSVMMKKQYALRASNDANHLVTFMDSTEAESLSIQEKRYAELVAQLATTHLQHGNVPYPWEKKMKQQQDHPQQLNSIFWLLVMPSAGDKAILSHNDVEGTMSKAMAWLTAAQGAGTPIKYLNLQTEPLLTKISGQEASRSAAGADSWEAYAMDQGVYGYEDYHGIDIGILRAVRLWYVPAVAEVAIYLYLRKGETKLGIGINRTDEGFCYVSSVEDGTVAERAGLKMLYLAAQIAGKVLVISRIGEEKITPSMVSSSGSIRCYDTVSISKKLSMHRQTGQLLTVHVLVWEGAVDLATTAAAQASSSFSRNSSVSTAEGESGPFISNRSVVLELVSDPESTRTSNASMVAAATGLHFRRPTFHSEGEGL